MKHKIHLYSEKLNDGNYKVFMFQSGELENNHSSEVLFEYNGLKIKRNYFPEITNGIIYINGEDKDCNYKIEQNEINILMFAGLENLVKAYNERQED